MDKRQHDRAKKRREEPVHDEAWNQERGEAQHQRVNNQEE
jgi:hypothetical protein